MTLQQLADRLAEVEGYEKRDGCWFRKDGGMHPILAHPYPVGDLTALAAAWPVGWTITIRIRHDGKCFAGAANAAGEAVGPNGWYDTEWEARANLHIAVREAEA